MSNTSQPAEEEETIMSDFSYSIDPIPQLSADRLEELTINVQAGIEPEKSMEEIVRSHIKFAIQFVSTRFNSTAVPYEDILSGAVYGMMQAVHKFDPKCGKFTTLAKWYMMRECSDAIDTSINTIKRPRYNYSKYTRAREIVRNKEKELHRPLEHEDLAALSDECGVDLKSILQEKFTTVTFGSLEDWDAYAKKPARAESPILARYGDVLDEVLLELTEKERDIINRRFGLDGHEIQTLDVIGRDYDVSSERIRQIESSTLTKLKQSIKENE